MGVWLNETVRDYYESRHRALPYWFSLSLPALSFLVGEAADDHWAVKKGDGLRLIRQRLRPQGLWQLNDNAILTPIPPEC